MDSQEQEQETTPDATTPIGQVERMLREDFRNHEGWRNHPFVLLARKFANELTAAKAEIAKLKGQDAETMQACQHWIGEYNRAESDNAQLRAEVERLKTDLREDRHLAKLADENLILMQQIAKLTKESPMNQSKPMTATNIPRTIQLLKEALTARNQDYGDVSEIVDAIQVQLISALNDVAQLKARLADQDVAQANLPSGTDIQAMQNELEWLRRWNAPGKLNEAETCRAIAEAWRDEKCQQAYVLLRAHHEREAGKYANAHMAAIMVASANQGVTQLKVERDQLRARVAELEKERTEWSVIYRRDYGHDWDTRGNYKGF